MNDVEKFLATATAFLTALAAILTWISRVARAATRRSETAIQFLLRRARGEALRKEVVLPDGRVSPDVLPLFRSFLPRLETLRLRAAAASDAELFIRIEDAIGDELVRTVCPTLGINEGACVYVVLRLVRAQPS